MSFFNQLNQQPDPRRSTPRNHVGRNPAANYATEPSTTHTYTRLTRTVYIIRTHLTHMQSSPMGSGTEAILSWALSQEVAHPLPRPRQQGPNTPRNCSPTPPSPLRAARGARAVPRATAPRSLQRHRMVRYCGWGKRKGKNKVQCIEFRIFYPIKLLYLLISNPLLPALKCRLILPAIGIASVVVSTCVSLTLKETRPNNFEK